MLPPAVSTATTRTALSATPPAEAVTLPLIDPARASDASMPEVTAPALVVTGAVPGGAPDVGIHGTSVRHSPAYPVAEAPPKALVGSKHTTLVVDAGRPVNLY